MINFQANLHTSLVSCWINLSSLSLPLIQLACLWFEKTSVHCLIYSRYRSSQNALDRRGHSTIPPFHSMDPPNKDTPLELTFIASAVISRMRMHCHGHMAYGTSPLYTSVWSLHDLHSLGPSALGCVRRDLHLGI